MTFAVEKAFDIVLDALIEKSKDEIDDMQFLCLSRDWKVTHSCKQFHRAPEK